MRLRVKHVTRYTFSDNVFLEPHYLRFRPRENQQLRLESFSMHIDPVPSGGSTHLDLFDNLTDQVFFNELHNSLSIEVTLDVSTSDHNPFNYLYHPVQPVEAIDYGDEKAFLLPFLDDVPLNKESSGEIRQMAKDAQSDITSFLSNALSYFYDNWSHEIVTSEILTDPQQTFDTRKGSCRDLSWLMITLLRKIGIASRYVGGYAYNPGYEDDHELHAWCEAYVPGGGWIGLDPSLGLFTTDHYIPVSTAPVPGLTLPVIGTFRGNATSDLSHDVEITALD